MHESMSPSLPYTLVSMCIYPQILGAAVVCFLYSSHTMVLGQFLVFGAHRHLTPLSVGRQRCLEETGLGRGTVLKASYAGFLPSQAAWVARNKLIHSIKPLALYLQNGANYLSCPLGRNALSSHSEILQRECLPQECHLRKEKDSVVPWFEP